MRINFVGMKHPNSISQINVKREKEMILLFNRAKRMVQWPTTTTKICEYVAQMPTSCYYLSDITAYRYVLRRLKGEKPSFGKRQRGKQSLCEAFFNDFDEVRRMEKHKDKSISHIVDITLERPAPNLGLTPKYIQEKISAYFNKRKRNTK